MSFLAVGVTAGVGITQAVIGGVKASKAHKQMEALQVPSYTPNKALSDYYQEALNRYNQNPYQSNFYEQAQKQAGRNLSTGIGALQDRHSAGNVGALVQGSDDQLQRAGVQAEGLQRQAFGQLGNAANMQNADYQRQFQYNKEAPYEKAFGIAQGKAIAGSQMENAGFSNITGGLGNYSMMKMFGGGGKGVDYSGVNAYQSDGTPLAGTGGSYSSPATGTGYIDPNGFGSGAIAR